MSILLVFENKDVKPWVDILQSKLPNTLIEVHPYVKDKKAVDFAICWKAKKGVLADYPNIKVMQSVGASIDHITNSQIINKNTSITRIIDEKLSNDMWEFLITIVLSELKNIKTYKDQQESNIWRPKEYKPTHEVSVSIMGLGSIGGYVADKFAQFGFRVKGWSNSAKQILNVDTYSGEEELDEFLKDSDFLINILPLTDKTDKILNKETLRKLPANSFFINVGRGEHLIDSDLIELIDSSCLSGAYLDVFRKEPLPEDHPFWNHPKIHITPHVASLTNVESASDQIVENYRRLQRNEELLHTVSITKGY